MRPLMIAACFVLTTAAFSASAQDAQAPAAAAAPAATTTPAPLKGDAARGKQLTYTCQGCHGVTGYKNAYPNYHVPKIGGQSELYLTNALTEYKKGTRKHPTMQAQSQSFSDQDIADIAAFLSTVK
ncbi:MULTISPECIES: cytochrome c [unclassified Lysobacter]|uniref:c-type cytochrome n=1 Tax=unclassified Lysobacter TaxID=2635362 RepID=UPI001C226627|nr:cytochrome c [Lysobacter sp. MMG2]MBU8974645.1 cytochrome c [Lysobacter sp. MMG2]